VKAFVFQYGSNTCTERLNHPLRLNGAAEVFGAALTESDFELQFDLWSEWNDCATADIVSGSGRRIWGVLYQVPEHLIRRETSGTHKSLDAIEGEGSNCQRVEIQVGFRDSGPIHERIFAYVGRESARKKNIQTSAKYVRLIFNGLKAHPVPEDYINYVKDRVLENAPKLANAPQLWDS
jgi:Gamma-glutamyl cyclotransferase, AIG2-like